MAELILTEKEKQAGSWMDLDDAALGKCVKKTMLAIKDDASSKNRLAAMTCALMICNLALDSNAETLTLEITDLTYKGEHRGDWIVTVERTPKA